MLFVRMRTSASPERLNGEPFTAFCPSSFQDQPSALGGHSRAKPMVPLFLEIGHVREILFHKPAPIEIYEPVFRPQMTFIVKMKLIEGVMVKGICPMGFSSIF